MCGCVGGCDCVGVGGTALIAAVRYVCEEGDRMCVCL